MTEASEDVVEAYARPSLDGPARWDEMVDPVTGVRETWNDMGSLLRLLGPSGLAQQNRTVSAMLAQDGVTYRPHGATRDRPWKLDPVPMLLDEREWAVLEPAITQRAELLDLILTDVYGPRRLLAEGLIPPEIILGHSGFIRAVDAIALPAPRQLFMAATDLTRGPDGSWVVLSDRTQAPSGTGYAMANRRVVSRALPGLFRDSRIQRLGPFFAAMRMSLQSLAAGDSEVPRIVLLTSGSGSETSFDQAFLSTLLGFPLVEGSDLLVRDGRVWQRSIGRLEPVDVILRRVDSAFCDPLELRPDSQLGVPGLIEASRLGTVSVVNGLGSGVLENPGLFPFLPRLSEVLLGAPLAMPSVPTWWCGEDSSRRHVLANLDSMVVKPVSRQIRRTSRFGWELSAAQRDELARRIEVEPGAWVGQDAVEPSTAPGVGAFGLEARPVSVRAFAVADGGSYRVLPGGLSRIAPEAPPIVGTPAEAAGGAQSKDVWVMDRAQALPADIAGSDGLGGRVVTAVSPRVAESLFWLGRYAERSEDISRLVAVADDTLRDVHAGADPALQECLDVLLRAVADVTSAAPVRVAGRIPPRQHLIAVIGDGTRRGTLAHDVHRLRALVNASRDQLSPDTWTVIGDLDLVLAPFEQTSALGIDTGHDVAASMRSLRAALMALAGLAAESMVRDAGWHFMDAGRRLERAAQIARLLRSCLASSYRPSVATLVEEATLVAAESSITHRRRYPALSGVATILELLLLDHDNPRSLPFQLDRLAADLPRLRPGAASTADDTLADLVTRIGARFASADPVALARADADDHRDALDHLLGTAVEELHELSALIEQAHFAHLPQFRQLVPLGDFDALDAP